MYIINHPKVFNTTTKVKRSYLIDVKLVIGTCENCAGFNQESLSSIQYIYEGVATLNCNEYGKDTFTFTLKGTICIVKLN